VALPHKQGERQARRGLPEARVGTEGCVFGKVDQQGQRLARRKRQRRHSPRPEHGLAFGGVLAQEAT